MKFTEKYKEITEAKALWITKINILKPKEIKDKDLLKRLETWDGPVPFTFSKKTLIPLINSGVIEVFNSDGKWEPPK